MKISKHILLFFLGLFFLMCKKEYGGGRIKSIKRLVLLLVLLTTLCPYIDAQKKERIENPNELHIELLGSGIIYSVNYERVFYKKNKFEFRAKAGIPFNPFLVWEYEYRAIGISFEPKINYLMGRNSIDFGIGYTYLYFFDNVQEEIFGCCADINLLIPRLGFKRYNERKTRFWEISFTPLFTLDLNEEGDEWDSNFFIPFGGLIYGWKF